MSNRLDLPPGHVAVVTDYGIVQVTAKTYKKYHDVLFKKHAPKKSQRMIDEALTKTACVLSHHEALLGRVLTKI